MKAELCKGSILYSIFSQWFSSSDSALKEEERTYWSGRETMAEHLASIFGMYLRHAF